jgi:hypothetical protein
LFLLHELCININSKFIITITLLMNVLILKRNNIVDILSNASVVTVHLVLHIVLRKTVKIIILNLWPSGTFCRLLVQVTRSAKVCYNFGAFETCSMRIWSFFLMIYTILLVIILSLIKSLVYVSCWCRRASAWTKYCFILVIYIKH